MVNLKKHRSKTRFSILNKLVIFFGTLILIAGFTIGAKALYIASTSIHELTDNMQALKNTMRILWFLMVIVSIIITILLSLIIVKPIKRKNKSYNFSTLFNGTISKIGDSVKLSDTDTMQQKDNDLASKITETASTINQIQTLAQAESVTETTEV